VNATVDSQVEILFGCVLGGGLHLVCLRNEVVHLNKRRIQLLRSQQLVVEIALSDSVVVEHSYPLHLEQLRDQPFGTRTRALVLPLEAETQEVELEGLQLGGVQTV